MKPIIGIILRPNVSKSDYDIMAVYKEVRNVIVENCGIPLGIIPPITDRYQKFDEETLKEYHRTLSLCDGFICQGGNSYHDYDKEAIKYAHKMNKPLFGLCLGMQTMSMVFNGEIVKVDEDDSHSKKGVEYAHGITIEKDSKLFELLKHENIKVNSRHKYCIKNTDLDIVARSDDNIVEAVEDKSRKFFIGVQWHPESMTDYDDLMVELFQQFIKACK